MTEEPKVFAMLREYDERKRELRALEEELTKECTAYGRDVLGVWAFAPSHLRQRLYALGLIENNHAAGSVSETKEKASETLGNRPASREGSAGHKPTSPTHT